MFSGSPARLIVLVKAYLALAFFVFYTANIRCQQKLYPTFPLTSNTLTQAKRLAMKTFFSPCRPASTQASPRFPRPSLACCSLLKLGLLSLCLLGLCLSPHTVFSAVTMQTGDETTLSVGNNEEGSTSIQSNEKGHSIRVIPPKQEETQELPSSVIITPEVYWNGTNPQVRPPKPPRPPHKPNPYPGKPQHNKRFLQGLTPHTPNSDNHSIASPHSSAPQPIISQPSPQPPLSLSTPSPRHTFMSPATPETPVTPITPVTPVTPVTPAP